MKVRKASIAAVVLVYEMFPDWIIDTDNLCTYVQMYTVCLILSSPLMQIWVCGKNSSDSQSCGYMFKYCILMYIACAPLGSTWIVGFKLATPRRRDFTVIMRTTAAWIGSAFGCCDVIGFTAIIAISSLHMFNTFVTNASWHKLWLYSCPGCSGDRVRVKSTDGTA